MACKRVFWASVAGSTALRRGLLHDDPDIWRALYLSLFGGLA